ncbi:MAG: hypothetical protein LBR85_00960 [Oscillospiraceae bacterium]|jgi:YbbR domain-containing protein|nr:hypothetical protein [Oscillospiraceae bacterium]
MDKQNTNEKRGKGINVGMMVLSLFISVGLWVYVVAVNDPETTVSLNIPVNIVGEDGEFRARNLMVTKYDAQVRINFRGSTSDIAVLNEENVSAEVNVSNITGVGEDQNISYTVNLPRPQADSVVVLRGDNVYVSVSTDSRGEKAVEFRLNGEIPIKEGYKRGVASFEPSVLTITGPQKVLNSIQYAEVTAPSALEPRSNAFDANLSYTLIDWNGERIINDLLEFDTETTNVVVPVSQLKEIPLTVEFIEGGGLTERDVEARFSFGSITVAGGEEPLLTFNSYIVDTVNLAELFETREYDHTIVLPNGMELVSGISEVHVTVILKNVPSRPINITNISAPNYTPPEGYELHFLTKQLNVRFRGQNEALGKLNIGNVAAVIDLENVTLTPMSPTDFPARIVPPPDTNVGVLSSHTVTVMLAPIGYSEEDGEGS